MSPTAPVAAAQQAPPPPPPPALPQKPKGLFFVIPPSLGTFVGIAGMVLFLYASTLPWYSIAGRLPSLGFPDWTPLIGFDGITGLSVHPELQNRIGLAVPSIAFPLILIFLISFYFRLRGLMRAPSHRVRSKSFLRGTLWVIVPIAITLALLMMLPSLVPASAPTQAHDLAQQIAANPSGGESDFQVTDPLGTTHNGQVRWGFGPGVTFLLAAAALMAAGAVLDRAAGLRARNV